MKIMPSIKTMWENIQIGLLATLILIAGYGFLKVVIAPLAPICTFAFVAFFTFLALQKRANGIMAVGGIFLYTISWFLVDYGIISSMTVWSLGVIIWFTATYRTVSGIITLYRRIPLF